MKKIYTLLITLSAAVNCTYAQWTQFGSSGNYYLNSGNVGIATTSSAAPTHSLTLGSTSTGIAIYNTADQTTNFERATLSWNSNSFVLATQQGGTGIQRPLLLNGNTIQFQHLGVTKALLGDASVAGQFQITASISGTANSSALGINQSYTNSAGMANAIAVLPTINQTSTAGYRGIWMSLYTPATGSGNKYLIDLGTNSAANGGGTHSTKFAVDASGQAVIAFRLKIGDIMMSPDALLELSSSAGYKTSAAYGTDGFGIKVDPITYTSTTSSGTITDQGTNTFGIPTLAASNATTITNASTIYVAGAPVAGANVTIAHPFALYVNGGTNYFAGNVGIGTPTPREALSVNGTIRAREVKIDVTNWPDNVFSPTYQLPSLAAVKAYIDKNHHLEDIPSEQEVAQNGIALGEMDKLLLKKVEELTLYAIQQSKQLADQKKNTQELKKRVDRLAKKGQ